MAVRRTTKAPEAIKEAVCRGCGHNVEYTLNDVHKRSGRRSGREHLVAPEGREWIVCECGHEITLRSW